MKGMSRKPRFAVLMIAAGLLVAGCGDDPVEPLEFEVIEDVTFHESLEVDLDEMEVTDAGVYWRDVEVGEGAVAVPGVRAVITYLVRYRDGGFVDSSDQNGAYDFVIDAADNTMAGFHEGVRGMRVGGERKFVVPPELGSGERGPTGILIFDVVLDSVTAPTT